MQEVWKRLIYQGRDYGDFYEVSNLGRIRSSKTYKIRKLNILKTGYYFVNGSLGSRDKKITFRVHRAVAESFIPNPRNLPQINHIDGNKLNNYINNLEWCNNAYNVTHAYALGHNKPWNEIAIYCNELKMSFKSITECARYLMQNGYSNPETSCVAVKTKIRRVLYGERKTTCGGLTFRYI